jgi:hypothetical protein
MNAPPPDDIQNASEGSMRPGQDLSIDPEKARLARNAVARRLPGEGGKAETDAGKQIIRDLGIEKGKP